MDISVIIPSYNCAKYIERALRSVLDQTFDRKHYEVIVVDNGSTDTTKKILKLFKGMVRVFTLKKNKGLSYARNYAIKNALGKFIVCVDADDYISNNLLLIEYLYLSNNSDMDAVSCDYLLVNDKEEIIRRCDSIKNPIACGIMFYKDKLKEVGLYDEAFLALEDLDLRKRYLEKFNIYNIPLPLYRYRDHRGNLTKRKEKIRYYGEKLFKKHKLDNLHLYLRNHKNIKAGVKICKS